MRSNTLRHWMTHLYHTGHTPFLSGRMLEVRHGEVCSSYTGCMPFPSGRMLEVRHWMVRLNRGIDFVSMDDILVDLKLTADVGDVWLMGVW